MKDTPLHTHTPLENTNNPNATISHTLSVSRLLLCAAITLHAMSSANRQTAA